MKIRNQKTIESSFMMEGVSLHSGKVCQITFHPSPADYGVRFVSDEDPLKQEICVTSSSLNGGNLGTNLQQSGVTIRTVEHLLAAIVSLEIDNLLVYVSGGEIPIQDGSSIEFVNRFLDVGLCTLKETKELHKFEHEISVSQHDKTINISPSEGFEVKLKVKLDFDNSVTKGMPMEASYIHEPDSFIKSIASARTFGFKKDMLALIESGLCLGGGLGNAILIGEAKIINPEGLRFNREIVNHKVLDLIGDLFPLLQNFYGFTVSGYKVGHGLNSLALKAAFEMVERD